MRFSNEELKQLLVRVLPNNEAVSKADREAAWKDLFGGLYGLFKTQALRAGLQGDDIDDVVGEMLLSIVASPQDFLGARDQISYISASARFAAIRISKARKRTAPNPGRQDEMGDDDNAIERLATPATQKALALSAEVRKAFLEALAEIPEPVRTHAILHYNDDISYEEIAYIAASTAVAVRVAVHRALKRLREKLETRLGEALPGAHPGAALRELGLPPHAAPAIEADAARTLERYILAPSSLAAAERRAVEARLEQDADYRLLRILQERRFAADSDVRGHADEQIPQPLLATLLRAARERYA